VLQLERAVGKIPGNFSDDHRLAVSLNRAEGFDRVLIPISGFHAPLPDRADAALPAGERPEYTPVTAAQGIEEAVGFIDGRWKLLILFHLFGGKVMRFSDLERAIPPVSQKMLTQQLRRLEADGIVHRKVHDQVPAKVEYRLTPWGQSLCPALDALLKWVENRTA